MDVFLAVVALFAAGGTFGMHASASFGSGSVPTPQEVATATGQGVVVVGQGTLVAGEMGWLNFLGPSAESVQEMLASSQSQQWVDYYAALDSITDPSTSGTKTIWRQHELPVRPDEINDAGEAVAGAETRTAASRVKVFFGPDLHILSWALLFVEGITALFGFIETPYRGEQINASKTQFSAGYAALGRALPDKDYWDSDSADEYARDATILQRFAAAAGVDAAALLMGESLDSQVQGLINDQATQIELMQAALAALALGLTLCVYWALYMESCVRGSSLIIQKRVAVISVFAASAVAATMAIWVSRNKDSLRKKAKIYQAMAAAVPSSVPDGPPSSALSSALGSGSASPIALFGDLNLPVSVLGAAAGRSAVAASPDPSIREAAPAPAQQPALSGPWAVARSVASRGAPPVRPARKGTAATAESALVDDLEVDGPDAAEGIGDAGYAPAGTAPRGLEQLVAAKHRSTHWVPEFASQTSE